jgi:hypothetical protein
MQNDTRLNRIVAAIVFLISWLIYLRTVAPTTSFWDCGEFITCSYILGVPHPPGAPLYILIGRFFSMIPFVQDIGMRVNIISTIASAITVMFAYLIIVRLIILFRGRVQGNLDRLIVYGSGVIGALTFAFTDSFWFNAVEAEVYAISMFFTSMVLWLILVWHEQADDPQSDKYILLIAFSLGLAIGVHLLMILAMPALFLVIYFRKYQKIEWKNFWMFVGLSLLAFVALYPGIVKWLPNLSLFLKRKVGGEFMAFFFLVFIAALLYGIYYAYRTRKRLAFLIFTSFFLVLLAASTYTSLYIRSGLNPEIDENDPENLENLVSYLNREQYGDWSYVDRRAPLWEYQIEKMYLRYFGWQFIGHGQTLDDEGRIVENYSLNGLLGLPFLVGLIGMAFHFRKDWKNASAIMLLFLFTGIAIVLYLNQEDPQPRERDYVYVGSFFAFALWIGIGITAIMDYLRQLSSKFPERQKLLVVIVAILLVAFILPANMLAHNFKSHDRTGEYVAYDYSYNILQSCEPNAILFTNGDNDTFPLWFLQYVYGIRKDVRVVNLSLLNTHWYIMQLRDQEPRVPISLSDTQIMSLQPQFWPEARPIRLEVPRDAFLRDRSEILGDKQTLLADTSKPPEITFKLEPTLYGKGIRVQDLMILDILRTNRFRRPIYFALTVSRDNQINLFDYLRMDGLVFKIVTYPTKDAPLSPTHLQANLFDKFQYRNLNNPDVYYNENIKGLLRNYQGAFYSLAQFYGRERMFDKMTSVLDKLTSVMPDSIIPIRKELQFEMGRLYYIGGQHDKFKDILYKMMNRSDVPLDEKLQYASYYTQLYPTEAIKAVELVKQLRDRYQKNAEPTYWLASHYLRTREYQSSIDVLNQWIARNPNDKNAADQLRSLHQLIQQSKAADSTANSSRRDSVITED